MKVVVHEDRCVAAAQCFFLVPEVFGQLPEGGVLLLDEDPPEVMRSAIWDAVTSCPGSVIEIED